MGPDALTAAMESQENDVDWWFYAHLAFSDTSRLEVPHGEFIAFNPSRNGYPRDEIA